MKPAWSELRFLAILLIAATAGCGSDFGGESADPGTPGKAVVVYTPESAGSLDALMREFQSATGMGYSLVSPDVAEPMAQADVYFGESFADLWESAEADHLRPIDPSLGKLIAAPKLADPERRFLPLSALMRGIVFNEHLVSAEEARTITDFSALADDRWRGRLCLSSSAVDGNRLLVAHLIRQYGVQEAEIAVRGWLANLAEGIVDSDADLLLAIEARRCALGILDFRWIGRSGWPQGVSPYPDIGGPLLLDIRGAGISRHARSPEAARHLLEWLLSARGNSAYARGWQQVPLSREIGFDRWDEFNWRPFAEVEAQLSELGFLLEEADRLAERAGYL